VSGADFATVDEDRANVMACQVAKAAGRCTTKPRAKLQAKEQTTPGGLDLHSPRLGAFSF
jgi:hypothetical protein